MTHRSWRQVERRLRVASIVGVIASVTIAATKSTQVAMPPAVGAPISVLLLYDMEGASGVLSDATMNPARPDSFAIGRASVIADVNAVVAGLFDAGVIRVDVENTHGAGGDSLVPRDRLDDRASIVTRKGQDPYVFATPNLQRPGTWNEMTRPRYDAVVTVAMHDKPMSGGFSPHTLGGGISPIIDSRAVTEAELVGYNFGTVGTPVIFASGDDRLGATLAGVMPWLEYVVVKRITEPTIATPLAADQVRQELHDGAVRAVRTLAKPGRARVMRLPPEFRAGLLPSYPLLLPPGIGSLPGLQKRGDTVTFVAQDYRSAFWGIFALQRIAAAFSAERMFRELALSPDSGAYKHAMDSLVSHMAAFEAGKWQPR